MSLRRGHQIPLDGFQILPSFEVIRDAFIASVDVTRCGVPNADFIHPVTRSPKPLVPRRGELEDNTSDRMGSFGTR